MVLSTDYTRVPGYAVDTGVANAYVVTLSPAPTAYVDGMTINVKIKTTNTASSTINVNGLGARVIYKADGSSLLNSGDLFINHTYSLIYNSNYGFMIVGGDTDAVKLGGVAASGYLQTTNKATQAEAEAGTDDAKYMTALKTSQEITKLAPKPKVEISRFTASGTWTVPAGVDEVDVYVVGGGAGGAGAKIYGGGGGGGYCKLYKDITVTPAASIPIVIGAGGAGGTGSTGIGQ